MQYFIKNNTFITLALGTLVANVTSFDAIFFTLVKGARIAVVKMKLVPVFPFLFPKISFLFRSCF